MPQCGSAAPGPKAKASTSRSTRESTPPDGSTSAVSFARDADCSGSRSPMRGMQLAKTPGETQVVEDASTVHVPAAPAPEVVFSAPTEGESRRVAHDVGSDPVLAGHRSGDLAGKIRVSYLESETRERGEPTTPTAEFTTQYLAPNRVARAEVHEATRALSHAQDRVAGRHPGDRPATREAVDADVPLGGRLRRSPGSDPDDRS